MKRRDLSGGAWVLPVMLALGLCGCLPEERFWWAPDGARALVRLESGLHVAGADGRLGAALPLDLISDDDLPNRACWLPDGSGFVINRVLRFSSWEEVAGLLPEDERKDVDTMTTALPALLTAWATTGADGNSGHAVLSWLTPKDKEVLAMAFYRAYQADRAGIEAILSKAPEGAKIVEDVRSATRPFRLHELCVVKLKESSVVQEPQALVRSARTLVFPKVSPKHAAVAFFHSLPDGETVALKVVSLERGGPLLVASDLPATHDWTPDGRSLVYVAPVMGRADSTLQRIQLQTVLGEDGVPLLSAGGDVWHARMLKGPVNLAMAIIPGIPRVFALPDGRVLFASQPATLPAPGDGLEVAPLLYTVTPDGKKVEVVPTAPGDLPANLGFFTLSPDGTRLAVVESDTDAVAVVELASGRVDVVSPAHAGWHCRTLPQWKSSTELTFAALQDGVPRWMLWTTSGELRCLSTSWDVTAAAEWLEKKKVEPAQEGGAP